MGKLIRTICGLFFILCLSSKSHAGPQGLSNYPWQMQEMPIWCGPLEMVNEALEIENYEVFEIAFGRAGANPEGELAYAVTTYASNDTPGHIVRTIETPEQVDKCIMNMLFDYKALEIKPSTNL